MKKLQKISILILSVLFISVFFIGCSNAEKDLKNKLSECTKTFFITQQEDFYITLNSGKRESDYQFDGKTDDMTDFALITLTFKNGSTLDQIPFSITINNNEISNILTKNPYKSNYMCDLGIQINDEDSIFINVFDENYELISKSKSFQVDYIKAENLAIGQIKNKITDNKNQPIECYLKIEYKPEVSENIFWFYLVKADKFYSIIIDSQTGQIVANY